MIKLLNMLIRQYKSFFYTYGLFLVIGAIILLTYSKEETFFLVNSYHNPIADIFFKLLTYLGDGLFFVLIILVLALYRYRLALLGLVIFLGSSLIAQVLKLTFFSDVLRPVGHFKSDLSAIHFVEGVTRHVKNSFPSGHTTTAFALTLFLVLAFNMKRSSWVMAIIAILVGYSRAYLAVHFPVDVYFGSIIGVFSAVLIYTWLDQPFNSKFGDKGLLRK